MNKEQEKVITNIEQAINKGWIVNVKKEEIMQNPLLAQTINSQGKKQPVDHQQTDKARDYKGKRRHVIDLFLRCPKCQHSQHEYVYNIGERPWIRCGGCGELVPEGAWGIISFINRLS